MPTGQARALESVSRWGPLGNGVSTLYGGALAPDADAPVTGPAMPYRGPAGQRAAAAGRDPGRRAGKAAPGIALSWPRIHETAVSAKLRFRPPFACAAGCRLTFKQSFEAPR